jgi:transcriptional regulator with XRE-family HTH domain
MKNQKGTGKSKRVVGIFGQRLYDLIWTTNNRFGRIITEEELGKAVGVTGAAVSAWIQGVSVPKMDALVKTANFLDVSTDYLAGISKSSSRDGDTQAFAKKYGLNDDALKTLAELTKMAEKNAFCGHHPLAALNIILSNYELSRDLLDCMNDIMFSCDYGTMKLHDKYGRETGERTIDADDMAAFEAISLHHCLKALQEGTLKSQEQIVLEMLIKEREIAAGEPIPNNGKRAKVPSTHHPEKQTDKLPDTKNTKSTSAPKSAKDKTDKPKTPKKGGQ